jgi:hypothetical protein
MPRPRPVKIEVNPINGSNYLKVEEGPIYFVVAVPDAELEKLRDRIDILLPRRP